MGQQDGIIRATQISDFVSVDIQLVEINCFPIFSNFSHDVFCISLVVLAASNGHCDT